jgi:sugar lactone lactonase YvrE
MLLNSGGGKLVRFDLSANASTPAQTIIFPPDVAYAETFLNDVRFDLRQGAAGVAYITDSSTMGRNGIVVVDLGSGRSWRHLDMFVSRAPHLCLL